MHGFYCNKFTVLHRLKIPTIYSIFEKAEGGAYTRLALLFQDILKYYIHLDHDGSFKVRELANWLLNHNQHWLNHYKDPSTRTTKIDVRVDFIAENIKDKIIHLIKLGVLEEGGTTRADKGRFDLPFYRYTRDGRLLAWIAASLIRNKRERANEEIYNIIQSVLKTQPQASYEIFHSKLYERYSEKGVFEQFIIEPLRESINLHSVSTSVQEFQSKALFIFRTKDKVKAILHLDLWDETFNEMEPHIQQLLLYKMKVDIEQRMADSAISPKTYEEAHFNLRANPDFLALEGYCKNCNLGYPMTTTVREYLERINFLPDEPIKSKCLVCKDISVLVPTL
jgi:hypothetical protein